MNTRSLASLEKLHRPLVALGRRPRGERPEIAALACLWILLAGVEAVFAGRELADHRPRSNPSRSIGRNPTIAGPQVRVKGRCLTTQSVELGADRCKTLCEDPDVVAEALDKDLGVPAILRKTFSE
jgi:hypothetical protein